jgi:hypothetical protein
MPVAPLNDSAHFAEVSVDPEAGELLSLLADPARNVADASVDIEPEQ